MKENEKQPYLKFICYRPGMYSIQDEMPEEKLTFTTRATGLDEVLRSFVDFLRGCGYQIKSNSIEVKDEDDDAKM